MKGRKPSPLRVLTGLPHRKRPVRGLEAPGELGDPPADLTEREKAVWRTVTAAAPHGLLRRIDAPMLRVYCTTMAVFETAQGHLHTEGLVVPSQRGGPRKSPWFQIARDACQTALRIGAELGLTPTSRARLHLPPEPARGNPFLAVLRGGAPKRGRPKRGGPEGGGADKGESPPAG